MSLKFDMEQIVNGPNDQTNFGSWLLKLIFKADICNLTKLRSAFPNAVQVVETYRKTGEILDLPDD